VRTVLILGGTGEGRRLAASLVPGYRVISSLAGRVRSPVLPPGEVRIGGFGGAAGLAAFLLSECVDAVVDATHPFAAQMSFNAADACASAGVPLGILRRPGWSSVPGDRWIPVADLGDAVAALAGLGERVLLTIGRQELAAFAGCTSHWFLARSIDPPTGAMPPRCEVLLARGPFSLADELALLRARAIDVVVTKNSGGSATSPKLAAARSLGLPVIMVARPPLPAGVPTLATPTDVLSWLSWLSWLSADS
jgi:precorrin-6A/cobalt-precorrin-6A reductase